MVALNVWPTDAADGSVANEARWRKMGRHWAPSGVVPVGGQLKPTLAGTSLTVADGAAWVDGHYAELLGSQVLTVTANGLAVVRFDPAANTAELVYRDGVSTPAQSPTGVWELPIAQLVGSALKDRRSFIGSPVDTGVMLDAHTNAHFHVPSWNTWTVIPVQVIALDIGSYWDTAAKGWRAPRTGRITVTLATTATFGSEADNGQLAFAVFTGTTGIRVHELYGQYTTHAATSTIDLPVTAGELVTAQVFTGGGYGIPNVTDARFQIRYSS